MQVCVSGTFSKYCEIPLTLFYFHPRVRALEDERQERKREALEQLRARDQLQARAGHLAASLHQARHEAEQANQALVDYRVKAQKILQVSILTVQS